MKTDNVMSGKQLEDRVKRRYASMKKVPLEHLNFVEQHAYETANALNIHLEGSQSKYILILVERDSFQCDNQYSGDEDL